MAEAAAEQQTVEQLVRVVGVRFKRAGKIYYFDPGELELVPGDRVLVETAAGVEFGEVVTPVKMVPESAVVPPIRPVLREAVREDYDQLLANRELERIAHAFALERIAARGLPMRLVNTEYTFDRNRLTFFFTSETRVDFRQLVRDLARQFGVRIELRQIGVRDEAKEVGGIGACGRELCCATWMGEFEPVSIRMAKEQRLSLNPSKLTGQCGRLKCCLKFENDTYRKIRALLPAEGDQVQVTVAGEVQVGRVIEVLVAKESVVVDLGEGRRVTVTLQQFESGEAVALTGKLAGEGADAAAGAAGVEPYDEAYDESYDEAAEDLDDLTWDMAAGDQYAAGGGEYAAALEAEPAQSWIEAVERESELEDDAGGPAERLRPEEGPGLAGLDPDEDAELAEVLRELVLLDGAGLDEELARATAGRARGKARKGRSRRGKAKAAPKAGHNGGGKRRRRRSHKKPEAREEGQ